MGELVLSPWLCTALELQATVLGHTWSGFVVGQLLPFSRNTPPLTGTAFTNKFSVLLKRATSVDPSLYRSFKITPNQILHKSKDGRYVVTIQQQEFDEGVLMVWQFSSKNAGTNSVSFLVTPAGFVPQAEIVSAECAENPSLLAQAGGEILGHLAGRDLLTEDSLCYLAVERYLSPVVSFYAEPYHLPASA